MFSVVNALAGFEDALNYVRENLIFFLLVALCLLAVIIICIILIVSGKKAKKKEKNEETSDVPPEFVEEPEPVTETTPTVHDATQEPCGEEETGGETAEKQEAEAADEAEETEVTKVATESEAVAPEPEEPEFITEKLEKPEEAENDGESDSVVVADAKEENNAEGNRHAYSGKWVVSKTTVVNEAGEEMDGAYFFQLKASNGESLITSEEYTTLRGAVQGIETFKANIARGNFKLSISKKGKYIVKLLTNQGMLLTQGEKYSTRTQALNAIASIKRFAATAVRAEEVQETTVPFEDAAEPTERAYDPYKKGKWVIRKVIVDSENDTSYCFELHASNGQTLFTSEDYATVVGLKNGIRTHKANIEKGNIKAVVTRNGDYIFKIFTGNGQLLCLGEHYKTKQLCLNAIESVKRFAQSAALNPDNIFPEE